MFYETLKQVCKENHTSPSAVVQALGMSKSNITAWKGGRSPKLDVVVNIANYLGVPPDRLIRPDAEEVQA